MSKSKKVETKRGPPHTDDEGQGRVTAETVVTEGRRGMRRFMALARNILPATTTSKPDPSKTGEESG